MSKFAYLEHYGYFGHEGSQVESYGSGEIVASIQELQTGLSIDGVWKSDLLPSEKMRLEKLFAQFLGKFQTLIEVKLSKLPYDLELERDDLRSKMYQKFSLAIARYDISSKLSFVKYLDFYLKSVISHAYKLKRRGQIVGFDTERIELGRNKYLLAMLEKPNSEQTSGLYELFLEEDSLDRVNFGVKYPQNMREIDGPDFNLQGIFEQVLHQLQPEQAEYIRRAFELGEEGFESVNEADGYMQAFFRKKRQKVDKPSSPGSIKTQRYFMRQKALELLKIELEKIGITGVADLL